jgi:anti-sigma B factor antagonist
VLRADGGTDVLRIRVSGDLDLGSAARLERLVDRLGDLRGHSLVIDLGAAGYVDSSGLGALAAVKLRGDREGFEVFVDDVPERVRRMLDVTGLSRLLVTAPPSLPG